MDPLSVQVVDSRSDLLSSALPAHADRGLERQSPEDVDFESAWVNVQGVQVFCIPFTISTDEVERDEEMPGRPGRPAGACLGPPERAESTQARKYRLFPPFFPKTTIHDAVTPQLPTTPHLIDTTVCLAQRRRRARLFQSLSHSRRTARPLSVIENRFNPSSVRSFPEPCSMIGCSFRT